MHKFHVFNLTINHFVSYNYLTLLRILSILLRNGCDRTGLYCTAAYIIEQMRNSQEVDVFTAVRRVRISRPEFIVSLVWKYFFILITLNCKPQYVNISMIKQFFGSDINKWDNIAIVWLWIKEIKLKLSKWNFRSVNKFGFEELWDEWLKRQNKIYNEINILQSEKNLIFMHIGIDSLLRPLFSFRINMNSFIRLHKHFWAEMIHTKNFKDHWKTEMSLLCMKSWCDILFISSDCFLKKKFTAIKYCFNLNMMRILDAICWIIIFLTSLCT